MLKATKAVVWWQSPILGGVARERQSDILAQGIIENYYQEITQRKLLESKRQYRTSDLMTFNTDLCLTNTEVTIDSYNNNYVTDIPKCIIYEPTSRNRMKVVYIVSFGWDKSVSLIFT